MSQIKVAALSYRMGINKHMVITLSFAILVFLHVSTANI